MTVLPPPAPVQREQFDPRVSGAQPVAPQSPRTGVERIVLGLLLAAAGATWLLDELGVSVPWALAPAVGVVVIGVALVLTARAPGGYARLAVWAGLLLAAAVALTVVGPVHTVTGPMHRSVGDRWLAPTAAQWPVATSLAAGNLTVDLRQNPMPVHGRMTASVTAGNVVLYLPGGSGARPVQVVAHVGMGQIVVDGVEVRAGMGLDWTSHDRAGVVVDIHVGAGNLEVDHG